MNYSKKHIKKIAYRRYIINNHRKYSHKMFKRWYAMTAFDINEMQQSEKYYG